MKSNLEAKKRLLLLGESGTSKTTLLMEIICDYFNEGYKVLYNLGDDDLRNTHSIAEKIKELVSANNKILVVIDNIHSPKMALIFNVIKNLQPLNKEKKNNLLFLLSARQPEFDLALERNLFQDTSIVQKIKSLFDNNYKFSVKYFEKEEVKEFIEKYHSFLNPILKNKSIEQNTYTIFKDTKGHPIMVRFAVLNEGLSGHIEQMYLEYLQDKSNNNYPHKQRLGVIILNSLFEISSISLKDELLDEFGLLKTARELRNTIIKKSGDVWKTIHPKWAMELFKYMFSLEYSLDDIKDSFIKIVKDITSNEKISGLDKVHILFIIYYILIKEKVTEFGIIEKMISLEYIESTLDIESKVMFYTHVMSFSYFESGKNEVA
ncbi:MAG TPA: ATP-binding protein, partial [Verrucomicrobiae bacterium]|nr:ATP-binding protein [Verrucomicrobiae bacterium]